MSAAVRGAKVTRACQRCNAQFTAREADVRRGWARFCSKSCKASEQEARTGQFADHLADERQHQADMDGAEQGWDSHKNWGAGA